MAGYKYHESEPIPELKGQRIFFLENGGFNLTFTRHFGEHHQMDVGSYPIDDTAISDIIALINENPHGFLVAHFITQANESQLERVSTPLIERANKNPRTIVSRGAKGKFLQYDEYVAKIEASGARMITRYFGDPSDYVEEIEAALKSLLEL